jgi:hopanoid-associated phosphorylase
MTARPLLVVTGMQTEAAIAAGPGVTVVCSAARPGTLRARLADQQADFAAVMSFGVAGALDPALRPGDLVLASEVRGAETWPASAELAAAAAERLAVLSIASRSGAVFGSDTPALTPAEKRRLRQQGGAILIDMESHIAAQWAAARDLPLIVLRVVADPAERALPRSAMAAIGPDGAIRTAPVLLGLLNRPADLPALVAAARDSAVAFRTLRRCAAGGLAGLLGGFLGADLR